MNKDDATWLNIAYTAFAGVAAYVFFQAFETAGFQFSLQERYDSWFLLTSRVLSITCGIALTLWLRADVKRREFHLLAIGEIRKVTWPTVDDTKKMTWIVLVFVSIVSVILSIFDIAWSKVLQMILP